MKHVTMHIKCMRIYGNLTFRFVLFLYHAKLWHTFGFVGPIFTENSSLRKLS